MDSDCSSKYPDTNRSACSAPRKLYTPKAKSIAMATQQDVKKVAFLKTWEAEWPDPTPLVPNLIKKQQISNKRREF